MVAKISETGPACFTGQALIFRSANAPESLEQFIAEPQHRTLDQLAAAGFSAPTAESGLARRGLEPVESKESNSGILDFDQRAGSRRWVPVDADLRKTSPCRNGGIRAHGTLTRN